MVLKNLDIARNNIRKEADPNPPRRSNVRFVPFMVVLLAIIVIFTFYMQLRDDGANRGKILEIDTRLGQIEDRLNRIEITENSISLIDEQRTKFEISLMNRLDGLESLITLKESTKTDEADTLHSEAVVKIADKDAEPEKEPDKEASISYHQVLAGETLYRISLKYGITVEELRRLNNIGPEAVIYVGQKLIVNHTP